GEGSFDLDADLVGFDLRAIMRAVDGKTSRAHRLEAGEAPRNPIGGAKRVNAKRVGCRLAGGEADQAAKARFVRRGPEMNGNLPLSAIVLEGGTGGAVGVKAFAEIGSEAPGGLFVAGEAGDGGGSIHALQVCPSHRRAQWLSRLS